MKGISVAHSLTSTQLLYVHVFVHISAVTKEKCLPCVSLCVFMQSDLALYTLGQLCHLDERIIAAV